MGGGRQQPVYKPARRFRQRQRISRRNRRNTDNLLTMHRCPDRFFGVPGDLRFRQSRGGREHPPRSPALPPNVRDYMQTTRLMKTTAKLPLTDRSDFTQRGHLNEY